MKHLVMEGEEKKEMDFVPDTAAVSGILILPLIFPVSSV
jgi:hypothetical protein